MRRDPVEEARRWLATAVADLADARLVAKAGRFHLACFLSQQAAEKAVKARLYAAGAELVLGHAVGELAKACRGVDDGIAALEADGRRLDRLDIPTRYPNGLPGGVPEESFDRKDADEAVALAQTFLDAVRRAVP